MRKLIGFMFRMVLLSVLVFLVSCGGYVGVKGNEPMTIPQAPAGMTYWEFMQDRIEAAKEVEPARCGTGKFIFFAIMTPFYSVLYTYVGVHPDSFLAKVTARDASVPTGVEGASLTEVPEMWWETVQKLSWSALVRRTPACNLRPVYFETH